MKHIIYDSDPTDWNFEEARQNIADNTDTPMDEISDEAVWRSIDESITAWNEDEHANLNKPLDGRIICLASLGLWSGRAQGYRMMGDNLNEILDAGQGDYYEVYQEDGNIKARDAHHDGTNYYTFRMIRPFVSEASLDRFLCKVYDGKANERDIRRYTQSLAPFVSEVYGWK